MQGFFTPSRFYSLMVVLAIFILMPAWAVLASTTDGTITGSAWSGQIGWINFGTVGGDAHVTDTGLTGYAWNENMGWINLGATQGGVTNTTEGVLGGDAWVEGSGWIDFTGVTINNSGIFSGTATGDNDVDINFDCSNCNVVTDWRPRSVRRAGTTSSGSQQMSMGARGTDLNNNGVVDIYDLALMMSQWNDVGNNFLSDLNGSGRVDEYDFSLLMLYWDQFYPVVKT